MSNVNESSIYEEFAALNEDPAYFLDLRLIPNRINHDATIGIFCYNFRDFFALRDIVKLLPEAELILAPALYDIKNKETTFYYNVLIRHINKEGIPWRIFIPRHYRLHWFFEKKYKTLVSRRSAAIFRSAELYAPKKILLLDESMPRVLTGMDAAERADLILLPGPVDQYPLRYFAARVEDAGISRFDSFTEGRGSNSKPSAVKKNLLYIAGSLENAQKFTETYLRWTWADEKAKMYEITLALPVLPHANALKMPQVWIYQNIRHAADNAGVLLFHENINIFQRIGETDILMVEDGTYLFDALFFETPVIFLWPAAPARLKIPAPIPELTNWREIAKPNPKPLDIGAILYQMHNFPAALDTIAQNETKHRENLRAKKQKFLSLHDGKATERTAEIIRKQSEAPYRTESLLSHLLYADGKKEEKRREREKRRDKTHPFDPW